MQRRRTLRWRWACRRRQHAWGRRPERGRARPEDASGCHLILLGVRSRPCSWLVGGAGGRRARLLRNAVRDLLGCRGGPG
eukprot:11099419-Alexandrium_andersonii.AAC.1